MPVFYTPIPQNLRVGLANVSGSVFINNRTRDSGDFRDPYQDNEVFAEVWSHLPLQMLLYFNMFFFPFWWISELMMLHLKFCYLPAYYQCLLVTGMVLISILEVLRVYLGYVGNLKEKVPDCLSSSSSSLIRTSSFFLWSGPFTLSIWPSSWASCWPRFSPCAS
ncbi:transmembrane protein [Pimephales promelas]|nr:transmembrane protein [Pimephales promelas]